MFLPFNVSALQRAIETNFRNLIHMGREDNPTRVPGHLIQDKKSSYSQGFACCAAAKRRSGLPLIFLEKPLSSGGGDRKLLRRGQSASWASSQ
jgi:hypothetical protein